MKMEFSSCKIWFITHMPIWTQEGMERGGEIYETVKILILDSYSLGHITDSVRFRRPRQF